MKYHLGLDIGIASIGWAVLEDDSDGRPFHIKDLGVRIFDKAEHPKDGSSLALPRRQARSTRRRLRRRRHRKERIKALFEQVGLISRDNLDKLCSQSNFAEDVYSLRADGLDRTLEKEEWARVLLHLSQRRGYRSNSTAEAAKDKENGKLLSAITANEELISTKSYRTVGEMFCKDVKFYATDPNGLVWRKTRNTSGDYSFTVTRDMVEKEVRALFDAQRKFGSEFASESFEEQYLYILLSQRGFDEGPSEQSPFHKANKDPRGFCSLEAGERRAFKASYTFEYFKLLTDINHLRILADGRPPRPLTSDERDRVSAIAISRENLNYGHLRKELALSDAERFNIVRYENDIETSEKKMKFREMQSYHEMRKALDHVCKGYISTLSPDTLDSVAEILSLYKSDTRRLDALQNLDIDTAAIDSLMPLSFSKVGNLSLIAMKKLIPHLEKGINYSDAETAVYGNRKERCGNDLRTKKLSFGKLEKSGALNSITNPVVRRAISQTFKVINAVVERYGSPQAIHIELAREMRKNYEDRKAIDKQYRENNAKNERLLDQIREYKGGRPTGLDLVKFKLFRDQNEICAYSGTKLEIERLFEPGYVDVDHILPYSISFDDSYNNKVLVLSAENRQKGNRLPLEYMHGDAQKEERFRTFVQTYIKDYKKRQKLLKEQITDEDRNSFKERNLVDTQYITREIYNILNDCLVFAEDSPYLSKPVRAVNGAVTDHMRKRFGLRKNREDGDIHHAMDAVVVAVTTDWMIERISDFYKRREREEKVDGKYVDPKTGELLLQDEYDRRYAPRFPYPWPTFRQELEARLSANPEFEIRERKLPGYDFSIPIKPVFVSRMPNRKVTGVAHKETIRSNRNSGISVVKTPLTDLKLNESGEISDYYNPESDRLLYSALKEQLIKNGGDGSKAFADPFHKPRRDGTPGPVVNKVKTYKKSNSNVSVRGGVADNGDMVRIDVFHVENDGYYFIPIYVSDTVKSILPQKAVVPNKDWKTMDDSDFLFSLYSGDLVRVESPRDISMKKANQHADGENELTSKAWLAYYRGADISTGSITIETHDRKYKMRGLGLKTLLSIEKYEVDPLGEYHRVHLPEKRLRFR